LPVKFPHKFVLYTLAALAGGGTVWTNCDSSTARGNIEVVSKATYETLADKLNQATTRLAVAETRIENLERTVYSRSSKVGPMATLHSDVPEPPPPAPTAQEPKLPSYDRVKELVQSRGQYAK